AELGRTRVRVEQSRAIAGRVAASAGDERAVDDDRLSFDVASDEVGAGSDADPHRLGGDALRACRLRARHREDRREIDRLAVGRLVAAREVCRPPVARHRERVMFDLESEALELLRHVGHAFLVRGRAGKASPPFVTRIAVFQRDVREVDDVLLHARAVDRRVRLLLGRQRPYRVLVVAEDQRFVIARQAAAVGLFRLRAVLHLREGRRRDDEHNAARRDRGACESVSFRHISLLRQNRTWAPNRIWRGGTTSVTLRNAGPDTYDAALTEFELTTLSASRLTSNCR